MKEIDKDTWDRFWFYASLPLRTNFWTIREKYDKTIDTFINDIMDRDIEGKFSSYTVKYGDVEIWISNYPYSYATIHFPVWQDGRPSLHTVYKFKKFIDAKKLQHDVKYLKRKADLLSVDRIAHKMFIEK